MESRYWKKLINFESVTGEWDWFHYPDKQEIRLVRFNELDVPVEELIMNYEQFEDLSRLIMNLNNKSLTRSSTTTQTSSSPGIFLDFVNGRFYHLATGIYNPYGVRLHNLEMYGVPITFFGKIKECFRLFKFFCSYGN